MISAGTTRAIAGSNNGGDRLNPPVTATTLLTNTTSHITTNNTVEDYSDVISNCSSSCKQVKKKSKSTVITTTASEVVGPNNLVGKHGPALIRPIPQRAAEAFYNTAYDEKLPSNLIQEAIANANEWHHKWTDPRGLEDYYGSNSSHQKSPTSDNSDDDDDDTVLQLRAAADMLANDREMARNPSPSQQHSDQSVKRSRGLLSSSCSSLLMHDKSTTVQSSQALRVVAGSNNNTNTVLARPFPVRPGQHRLVMLSPSQMDFVKEEGNDLSYTRCVSPLSVSTVSRCSIRSEIGSNLVDEDDNSDSSLSNMTNISSDEDVAHGTYNKHVVRRSLRNTLWLPTAVESARDGILHALAISGGETTSANFHACLALLQEHYQLLRVSCDYTETTTYSSIEEGMWLTLTKPTFIGTLGDNDSNDPMYTLGRMSFDMFSPGDLICSLQGNFNHVEKLSATNKAQMLQSHRNNDHRHYCSIPEEFSTEVETENAVMRTYHIVTAFTIEPSLAAFPKAPNKNIVRPIRGIMTTYGFTIPDPFDINRRSVWIAGGKIEPNNNDYDKQEWIRLFGEHYAKGENTFSRKARLLSVRLLMGATTPESVCPETGKMEYTFSRPRGGHGRAYVDTLYCDNTLRIVKGHRGTIYVFTRVPPNKK